MSIHASFRTGCLFFRVRRSQSRHARHSIAVLALLGAGSLSACKSNAIAPRESKAASSDRARIAPISSATNVVSPESYLYTCVHLQHTPVRECVEIWKALLASHPRKYVTPGPTNQAPPPDPVVTVVETTDPRVLLVVGLPVLRDHMESVAEFFRRRDQLRGESRVPSEPE